MIAIPRTLWMRVVRFVIALVGVAAAIHIVEFHLGLGTNANLELWWPSVVSAAAHCPVLMPLTAAAALGFGGVALYVVHLRLESCGMQKVLSARTKPSSRLPALRKVLLYTVLIAILERFIFQAVMGVMPMSYAMRMNGAMMTMPMTPPMPVWILCVIFGALAALLLLRLEREIEVVGRLIVCLSQIAMCRRVRAQRIVAPIGATLRPQHIGSSIRARAPPLAASA